MQRQQKERSALLQAKTILQEHQPAYDALVAAMSRREALESCLEVTGLTEISDVSGQKLSQ